MSSIKNILLENQELHEKIISLEDMISQLQDDNEILADLNDNLRYHNNKQRKMIEGLKLNNSKLTLQRNELQAEVDKLRHKLKNVTLYDLSEAEQERAGHLLAKSLLGR